MLCAQTFLSPQMSTHKQYEALRAYYVEGLSAAEVADRFGYTLSSFYSLLHQVRQHSGDDPTSFAPYFFVSKSVGRKPKDVDGHLVNRIVKLRDSAAIGASNQGHLGESGRRLSKKAILLPQ